MTIDVVDDRDRVIGSARRDEVLRRRLGFRVVHVFVFNSKGELLLQRLPATARHPGTWGSSVAGYLFKGETYERAAKRRLQQELGIDPPPLHRAGVTTMDDSGSLKHITLFHAHHDGPFRPDLDAIADLTFFGLNQLTIAITAGTISPTPTLRRILVAFGLVRPRA